MNKPPWIHQLASTMIYIWSPKWNYFTANCRTSKYTFLVIKKFPTNAFMPWCQKAIVLNLIRRSASFL